MDGRILVSAAHPKLGLGIYLLTRRAGPKPVYEPVQCELTSKGLFHRMSISPSEKKICFEHSNEFKASEYGHTLYLADFDAQQRTITNLKVFANAAQKQRWFAYPRWIDGESAVIYHSGETDPKHNQLYVYRLDDGSTKRVSTNPAANYLYPHGEAAPY
jgi:Tol biopolymer transport system component